MEHAPPAGPPLRGVAALADRPVDPARVARIMALVALGLALGAVAGVERLLSTADGEPRAASMLRARARPAAAPLGPPGRAAVLYVDGLRVDEARRLPSWRRLDAARGQLDLPLPTLSRAFQHTAFTGVPPSASGVRSNRFTGRARFESVMDRVRAAGGRVILVGDGLDWVRRMHGLPGDGGSDARGAVEHVGARYLPELLASPAPSLLVVHAVAVDGTAHAGDAAGHRAALEQAERLLATLGAADVTLFALSDHGHVRGGGHGGPEPVVARAPLLIRDPRGRIRGGLGVVALERLAATIAAHLGVARPRHAVAGALGPVAPDDPGVDPLGRAIARGAWAEDAALARARRIGLPLVLALLVLGLGPIKRAFGLDRALAVAALLWPLLVVAGHLALGRPLSLSAIDGRATHVVRVAALGVSAALVAAWVARAAGRGPQRSRRAWAAVAWAAAAAAGVGFASCGLALGPWALSARGTYLPLLFGGAAAAALATASVGLWLSGPRRSAASPPTARR